jgi:hypothetical protein
MTGPTPVGLAELTTTDVVPFIEGSWAETAVILAVPAAIGVKTPTSLTVPMLDGATFQLTEEL